MLSESACGEVSNFSALFLNHEKSVKWEGGAERRVIQRRRLKRGIVDSHFEARAPSSGRPARRRARLAPPSPYVSESARVPVVLHHTCSAQNF